jgi:hypothetical protein
MPAACKAIVDALNAEAFEIHGRVEAVSVIGVDGETVWGDHVVSSC